MANKYHNRKVTWDGLTFDSEKERDRYKVLKAAQERGEIRGLRCQVEYELIPKQTRPVLRVLRTKTKVEERCAERAVKYMADFVYAKPEPDGTWQAIVEDVKGAGGRGRFSTQTKDFVIKRKLMLYVHGIVLKVVTKPNAEI